MFEAVKNWWAAAILVQNHFRMYHQMKVWKLHLKDRERATLMIQCLWRGLMARRTAAFLRRQQISEWEEVWNDEAAVFYFFHKPSGGSSWEVSWRVRIRSAPPVKLVIGSVPPPTCQCAL